MKAFWTTFGIVIAALLVLGGVYMIDVDQTQEARLPDVDVSVEGGQLPEFDAEVGSVEITEEKVDVTVPNVDVDVSTETKTVEVPGIEVTPPEDADG